MDLAARAAALAAHIGSLPGATAPFPDLFPASSRALDDAEAQLGTPLPPELRAFYEATDGLDLRWAAHDPSAGLAAEGVVGIVDLALAADPARAVPRLGRGPGSVLAGPTLLFESLPDRHDVLVRVGGGACAFVLVLPDGTPLDLELTLADYLDRALDVGGLYGWHLRRAPDAGPVLAATSDDRFEAVAPVFFPDAPLRPSPVALPTWPAPAAAAAFDAAFATGPDVARRAPPVSAGAVRRAEMAWGARLPPALRSLYGGFNGAEVRWGGADDDRAASFRVLSLEEVAGGPDWMVDSPWSHDGAKQVGAPASSPLATWRPLLVSEGLDIVWQADPPRLGAVDGGDVRPLATSLEAFVVEVTAPGGPVPWLRQAL